MFWSVLVGFVVAIPLLLFWLYDWAAKDPGVDRDIAYRRFRDVHELRGIRRSGNSDSTPIRDSDRLQNDP